MSVIQIPWKPGFSIGTGISDFTGLPAKKPWAFEDPARNLLNRPQPEAAVQGNVTVSKGVMSNSSHYKQALQASASMSIKLWGANAHAGSKLMTELQLNRRTVHYVVTCNFETETVNILDRLEYVPILSTSAKDLLVRVGPDKWAEQYGTHFVSGYVRGGKYVGKATITDRSTEGLHGFQASMGAKLGAFASGSASHSVQFDHSKVRLGLRARIQLSKCCAQSQYRCSPMSVFLQERHEVQFDVECTGANLDLPQPNTIQEMVDFASHYAQNNKGVHHLAVLSPFATLESYNGAEAQYNGAGFMIWLESGNHLLTDLNFEYVRLQRLKFVLAEKTNIDKIPDADFSSAKQEASSLEHTLSALIRCGAAAVLELVCDIVTEVSDTIAIFETTGTQAQRLQQCLHLYVSCRQRPGISSV